LAALLDEYGLEVEIRIKILALLQLFYGDPLCRCYPLKFLRGKFSVDLPAQTGPPQLVNDGSRIVAKIARQATESFLLLMLMLLTDLLENEPGQEQEQEQEQEQTAIGNSRTSI
jgi:hypothetical protein